MCITRCVSLECHEFIYGGDELEPGEIDDKRADAFDRCAREELRQAVAKERRERAKQSKDIL